MRIICDECNQPISGTVKRTAGNFNLHPECLAQFSEESIRSNNESRTYWQLFLNTLTNVEVKQRDLVTR